jgi:hypothetical protein
VAEFVQFEQPNGHPCWINPELVSYLRPIRDGEAGRTLIWMEGSGIYVISPPEHVIRALGGDNGASQIKSSS